MADYKASTKSVASWQRCYRITIENPYESMPSIRFDEELCAVADGKVASNVIGSIFKNYDNQSKIFQLRNPLTGDLTGSAMTYGELYAVLWSLYMALAEERDAQPAN